MPNSETRKAEITQFGSGWAILEFYRVFSFAATIERSGEVVINFTPGNLTGNFTLLPLQIYN